MNIDNSRIYIHTELFHFAGMAQTISGMHWVSVLFIRRRPQDSWIYLMVVNGDWKPGDGNRKDGMYSGEGYPQLNLVLDNNPRSY